MRLTMKVAAATIPAGRKMIQTVDVLEGRQALGNPEKKGGK